jgi:hypothetical protein
MVELTNALAWSDHRPRTAKRRASGNGIRSVSPTPIASQRRNTRVPRSPPFDQKILKAAKREGVKAA